MLDVLLVLGKGILVNIRIKPSQAYSTLATHHQTSKQMSKIRLPYITSAGQIHDFKDPGGFNLNLL